MQLIMSLLVLGAGLINNLVASDSAIPTQAEQADLLLNVQQVFEEIKLLIKDEALSTDISVVKDIELLVERANYTLNLLEEMVQLRLSSGSNVVCMLDFRSIIERLATDGRDTLKDCLLKGSEDIRSSSNELGNVTNAAIAHGQQMLDSPEGLQQEIRTGRAIEAHRTAHFKAIGIRAIANECVDDVVRKYRDLLEDGLQRALRCV
ncbi:hypothetical protein NQ317_000859 [Molorchus minor]|uniref:Secreted protein n=1 Tax=Molorchus minor TaxID=1323400 RepID=A0ABQ9JTM8_9CUCU|nr:hypothetical protein NQ317_000859 [Molorchus minor]